MVAEEWSTAEHALRYLARADSYPRRGEGEAALLEQVPHDVRRILDLGTGDGRLLALLHGDRPEALGIGLDVSEPMLGAARKRFAGDRRVELIEHDLAEPLPALGRFDAVVSSFAIHHLEHRRKRSLYAEILDLLEPGGVFANLEHVASPTPRLHLAFLAAIGEPVEDEDPSDRLLDVGTQLGWLREHGFEDVDCYWKWLEMALLVGGQADREVDGLSRVTADDGFVAMLAGGKRQSIGESNAVAQEVQAQPDRAAELWEAIACPDPLVHMRAVDALEKVSAARPKVLRGHEREVLEDLPASELPEVRWHVGLLIPRLELDARQLPIAGGVLERLLDDPSRIVQANALDGIVRLADDHAGLVALADAAMNRASQSPHASVRARARRLTR